MSRRFCGRADQHEAHALSGRDYCPGRPLADGEATPYGAGDTWPELTPVPWVDPSPCGYGWGG